MKLVAGNIFKHYKNHLYIIKDIAIHTETLQEMVVYKQLYMSRHGNGFIKCPTWVRPKTMFLETVNVNGQDMPRFKYVGRF